jgi:very-short-patch-repair endonuclease
MNLNETVARVGHLATRRQLAALGFGDHAVRRALASKSLVKVRPGWVGTRAASQLSVIAALQGGRLTSATALASYDIWSGTDRQVHVQIPANAHRTVQHPIIPIAEFASPEFTYSGIVRHWVPCQEPRPTDAFWRVTVADALIRFARTESEEQLAASIESSVHKRMLSRNEIAGLFLRLPKRLHPLRSRLTFRAESGLESVAQLRLADCGFAVMQQVQIGPDRVDLVIDGWLVVELDGDKWHDPAKDRIRTNRLIRAGYRVLRFGYADVFHRWDETLATIHEMLGVRHPLFR